MYPRFSNRISQLSLSRRMFTCVHVCAHTHTHTHTHIHTHWGAASEAVPSGLSPGIGALERRWDPAALFKESDMAEQLGVTRRLPTWRRRPPPCPLLFSFPVLLWGSQEPCQGFPEGDAWNWELSLLPTGRVNRWLVNSVRLGWDVDFPGLPRPTQARCKAGPPPAEPRAPRQSVTTWTTWVRGNWATKLWSNACVWFEVTRSWGSLSHGET